MLLQLLIQWLIEWLAEGSTEWLTDHEKTVILERSKAVTVEQQASVQYLESIELSQDSIAVLKYSSTLTCEMYKETTMSPLEGQKSNRCTEKCSRLVFYDFPADSKTQARGCRVTYSEAATEIVFSLRTYVFAAQQQHQLGESNWRTLVCTTTVHFCREASYAGTRKLSFNGTDF